MTTRTHLHSHSHLPLGAFAMEHPYASEWFLVIIGTLAALLLWYWNR